MDVPDGLLARGSEVYLSLVSESSDASRRALAHEAGRMADRLDELDRIIAGKGVLELMQFRLHESWDDEDDRTVLVQVKFDAVLAEARQQANTLKQVLVSLGLGSAEVAAPEKKGSTLDELNARRAARAANSSG